LSCGDDKNGVGFFVDANSIRFWNDGIVNGYSNLFCFWEFPGQEVLEPLGSWRQNVFWLLILVPFC
jgi:hypothetical protein